MLCGRELGGARTDELGVCMAAKDERLNRVHGGKNAGRTCWVVAGTFSSKGKVECVVAKEYGSCATCDFYYEVKREEGKHTWPVALLLRILGEKTT